MTEYDLGKVVGDKGDTGATGNGIASIELYSTSGKQKTYRITYTNGNHFDFVVTDGDDGGVTIVTSFGSTTSDSKVPSEKLTKTELDKKISTSSTAGLVKNDGSIDTNTYLTSSSLSNYMQKSSTAGLMKNDGTVDTNTYLTSSALSNYVQKSSTTGLLKNDGTVDTTSYSTFSGAYSDLSGKPTIPSKISDLTNDSDFIETSSTAGLVKNDGTIDTTSYLSSLPSHTHGNLTNDGKVGSNANYIVVTGTGGAITSVQKLGNITYDGKIGSTGNKPLITTTGGTITTGSFGTTEGTFAAGNHTHSGYASSSHTHGDITNDGKLDGAILNGAENITILNTGLSGYIYAFNDNLVYYNSDDMVFYKNNELATTNDIPEVVDNLTTDNSSKALSAKQGKALKDLIGNAITYINQ